MQAFHAEARMETRSIKEMIARVLTIWTKWYFIQDVTFLKMFNNMMTNTSQCHPTCSLVPRWLLVRTYRVHVSKTRHLIVIKYVVHQTCEIMYVEAYLMSKFTIPINSPSEHHSSRSLTLQTTGIKSETCSEETTSFWSRRKVKVRRTCLMMLILMWCKHREVDMEDDVDLASQGLIYIVIPRQ